MKLLKRNSVLVSIFVIFGLLFIYHKLFYTQPFNSDLISRSKKQSNIVEPVSPENFKEYCRNGSPQNSSIEYEILYMKMVDRRRKLLTMEKTSREIWEFYPACRQFCPKKLSRVGQDGDGGKFVCGVETLKEDSSCIVYSFGVSTDSSFEADMLNKTGCTVYAYDPSVTKIGAPLEPSNSRVKFQQVGISGRVQRGFSLFGYQLRYPLNTLKTLMTANGHKWIDILKVDVEGSEFESLISILNDFPYLLPFGQLLIEVHTVWLPQDKIYSIVAPWWDSLENNGLRPFSSEVGSPSRSEYSFINTKATKSI